jgi:cytochrome c biogenesis protein CcmG/thiol:disulfide interchange protein DsbE
LKRLIYILPIIVFAALAAMLYRSLVAPAPEALPSALIDRPAPALNLPGLDGATRGFGPQDLKAGHVTVVNVWASWCVPCRTEAPELEALAREKGFALYGLVYKDTPEKARAFLDEVGNPFSRVGLDRDGRAGIEWGIYGVPETFIVDGKGIVRERFVGPLSDDTLASQLLPAIAEARS